MTPCSISLTRRRGLYVLIPDRPLLRYSHPGVESLTFVTVDTRISFGLSPTKSCPRIAG